MPLRNTLPEQYESYLTQVFDGEGRYEKVFLPIFKELNPARATSIANEMRKAIWSLESQFSDGWWIKSQKGPKSIMKALDARPECAPLFSVSGNGYIREKAVNNWIRVDSSFELALLLVRLNDWVPKVRSATISKLEKFLNLSTLESGLTTNTILGCMDLILNPARFGRSREIEFRVLNQLLNINDMPIALAEFISGSAIDSAPRFLKLGLKRGILTDALPTMAKQGKHPEVRRISIKTLLDGKYSWNEDGCVKTKNIGLSFDKDEVAKTALSDKFFSVKCVALDYISELKPANLYCEKTFREFLPGKHATLVERAVFGLKTLGIDYASELREQVAAGDSSIHSLEILGRFGSTKDTDLILTQAIEMSGVNKIRALSAAANLGDVTAIDMLEQIAFESPDDQHARLASKTLASVAYSPNADLFLASIRNGQHIVQRGFIRLMKRLPTMKLALVLSECATNGTNYDLANLWKALIKKRNIGAFLPTTEEIDDLKQSVGSSESLSRKFNNILGLKL